jgi:hypothetical protein
MKPTAMIEAKIASRTDAIKSQHLRSKVATDLARVRHPQRRRRRARVPASGAVHPPATRRAKRDARLGSRVCSNRMPVLIPQGACSGQRADAGRAIVPELFRWAPPIEILRQYVEKSQGILNPRRERAIRSRTASASGVCARAARRGSAMTIERRGRPVTPAPAGDPL